MTEASREGVKPPLDFTKIEALRRHMRLTTAEFASLCGVSRMTYYAWVNGQSMRKKNDEYVRRVVRSLLALVHEDKWPEDGIQHLSTEDRMSRLNKLLAEV
jgi:DNA-binding transcriptional regulator YiaG